VRVGRKQSENYLNVVENGSGRGCLKLVERGFDHFRIIFDHSLTNFDHFRQLLPVFDQIREILINSTDF
jgi:hypothetical protein